MRAVFLVCYYDPPLPMSTCECSDMAVHRAYATREDAESAKEHLPRSEYPNAFVMECDFDG